MSEVEVPDELPCEKCGEMTAYDGVIGDGLACEHCETPDPHTLTGLTGSGGLVFMIFFVVALFMVLIDPFGMGEGAIVPIFGIFALMFLFFFLRFVIVGMKMKREAREKAAQEKSLGEG
jgi:hypothetical protein